MGKGYILRVRDEENEKKRYKISIKHRHPDRYISASKDLSSPEECETKFEEDITSPFISKFSHSTCVKSDSLKNLERVKHLLDLFPDLDIKDHEDKKLKIVNGFKAYEISCRIGSFYFEDETPIKACINFWYDNDQYIGKPLVVEFSFDYDIDDHEDPHKKLEKYSGRIVHNCHIIFNKLQNNRDWLADSGTGKTKTDIAYGKARKKLFNSKLENIIN